MSRLGNIIRSLGTACALVVAVVAVAESPAGAFSGGTGTSLDPYQIASCADLFSIDDTTANLSKSYVLTANVDCSAQAGLAPMANGSTYFSGTLDGGSHTISNVIMSCGAGGFCALFARFSGLSVRVSALTLQSFQMTSSGNYAGALSGYCSYSSCNATVEDVSVVSSSITGSAYAGGLVGDCQNCTVRRVSTSGSVTATAGGFAGGITGNIGASADVNAMLDTVSSSATVSGVSNSGGITGYFNRSSLNPAKGLVTGATFSGSVSITTTYAGGLVGFGSYTPVELSSVSGSVTGGTFTGGIAGDLSNGSVTRSQSTGNVTITNVATCGGVIGGILGTGASMTISETFSSSRVEGFCRMGGLVGTSNGIDITNSYFNGQLVQVGTATYAGSDIGGLVGLTNNSGARTYTNSYAVFTKTSAVVHAFGGIVGSRYGVTTIPTCTNTLWDKDVPSESTDAACSTTLGLSTSAMKTQSTFTSRSWDFSTVWQMNPAVNNGYPYLRATVPPDTTAPVFVSGELLANGHDVVLTYGEALHSVTALPGAFVVRNGAVNIVPVSVAVGGSTVTLTLAGNIDGTASITVDYVAPAGNSQNTNNAIQDAAGNDSTSLSQRSVTNSSTADATPPDATLTAPASPSSSRAITFTVTFTEPVTGIAAGDFGTPGSATGCSATPSASSASASITVDVVCSSDGTVTLVMNTSSVVDASNNAGPTLVRSAGPVTISTAVVTTTTLVVSSAASTTTTMPAVVTTTTTPALASSGGTTTTGQATADGDVALAIEDDVQISGSTGTATMSDGSTLSIGRTGSLTLKLWTGYIGTASGSVKATYKVGTKSVTWSCTIRSTAVGKVNKKAKRSSGGWFPKSFKPIANRCVLPPVLRTALTTQKVLLTAKVRFVKKWPTTGKAINAETGARILVGMRTVRITLGG